MTRSDRGPLRRGREAFERRAWADARNALGEAGEAGSLPPADCWRLALASYLTGDEHGFVRSLENAHHGYLAEDECRQAVRCAFWIGLHLAERGEMAKASGWFGRAGRLLERIGDDCAERGYLLLPAGQRQLGTGEYEACVETALRAEELGQRHGDDDLLTLALHMRGRALLREGHVEEGFSLLDEAMVSVVSDELSPQVTGLVYCSVISACREVWEVRRAQEWTAALTAWCERQPDMVAYTGECRVYRAEILQQRGAWREALEEARQACERLAGEPQAGAAFYQRGEAHRLLGQLAAAEEAYREASRAGREPQPGFALLRLAQGDVEAAAAATRRALAGSTEPFRRARLLPAHIEVMLEVGDLEAAARACDELEEIAETWGARMLAATAERSRGAIALQAEDAEGALPHLRRAWKAWQELDAPHEAAWSRALLGLACRALGDEDGAELELQAARAALEELGAAPAVARLESLAGRRPAGPDHGLTPREREVLSTAYAYEHDLLEPRS